MGTMIMGSLGGGTGSGLSARLTEVISFEFKIITFKINLIHFSTIILLKGNKR